MLSLRVKLGYGTLNLRLLVIIIIRLQMDTESFSLGLNALLLPLGLIKRIRSFIREPLRILGFVTLA
jgi:hypothetical protein